MSQNKESLKDVTAGELISSDTAKEVAETFLKGFEGGLKVPRTRKEKKALKKEFDRQLRQAKDSVSSAERQSKEVGLKPIKKKSIAKQLKERDRELSTKTKKQRDKRRKAKHVTGYIGYDLMFKTGICQVEEGLYSETVQFSDISYQSSREESQKNAFSNMCSLADYFGEDTILQYNVINTPLLEEEIGNRHFWDPEAQKTENQKHFVREYNKILNDKMREGVSNIKRSLYVTYATGAESPDSAAPALARMRSDTIQTFANIRSEARVLDGEERLKVLHSQLRPLKPFLMSYDSDISLKSGLCTKDLIAPSSLDFKPEGDNSYFKTEDMYGQILVFRRFGSELNDRALSDVINLPLALNVSWIIQGMDKARSIAFVKQRAAWIDKEIIEEQRGAVKKGYDFSILPAELKYSKEETADVLDHLQNKNQRLFLFTGLVYTYAPSIEQLQEQCLQIIATARRNSIDISTLEYRQKEGLNSVLPLGHNHVDITRMFTTAQVGIFMPFASQELDHKNGNYYGQNKVSNNLVICNRKRLASPMGFISGKTGSGKSFAVKEEIQGTILGNAADEIIILDRSGEYTLLTEANDGQVITFSADSATALNPFDLSDVAHLSREGQISFKVDAMLAQAAASAAESGSIFDEADQSIVSRCVELAYKEAERKEPGGVPLLEDFCEILKSQDDPAAREKAANLALRYERFIHESQDFFNRHSTVTFENRITDINLKPLPDSMLVFTLITVLETVRNRMYRNFERGVRTWLYIEEIQSMFRYPTVLAYFSRFANEGRKFGMLMTGITQSSVALLEHEAARNIVLNSDFIFLLRQSPLDRMEWSRLLGFSALEESYIDESVEAGDGLLIAGAAKVPVRGKFPKGNPLYTLFDTDPNAVEEAAQKALLEANIQKVTGAV